MSKQRNKKANSLRPQKVRNVESLESRQLMTTAMGVDASFDGLYKIDLDSGNVSEVGKLHPAADRYTTPVSMAVRPSDNKIFVINNSPIQDRGLSVVNPNTGRATRIGDSAADSITFGPGGTMYAIANGELAKVDPATGETTDLRGGDIPTLYGLDYRSSDGHLYGVTGNVDGESVLLKIQSNGVVVKRMPLTKNIGTVPGGMVFDGDRLVVTNISNVMYDVDPDSGEVTASRRAEKSAQGLGILQERQIPSRRPMGTVYGIDAASDSIYTVNLSTGDTHDIGPLHPDPARYTTPVSMAIRPSDDAIFVINNSPVQDSGLSIVDKNTGLATKVTDVNVETISFGAGNVLYGISGGELVTVNTNTGATRELAGDTLPRLFGLDYNWDDGFLYGITGDTSGDAELLKITTTGRLVSTTPLSANIGTVPGSLVFGPDGQMVVSNISRRLYDVNHNSGAVSNSRNSDELIQGLDVARRRRAEQPTGAVFAVDSSSDSLYKINLNTGDTTEIGSLHPDSDRYTTPVSLAMRPSDDALFVINNSPESDKGLSVVDKATGLATHVAGVDVETIAFDALSNMYGLSGGKLVEVNAGTGATTNLGGDQLPRLFGLDYNWNDGNLYGISGNVDGESTVYKISTSGEVLDKVSLDRNIDSVPGSLVFNGDGTMVVSNLHDHLFDVNPMTGEVTNCRLADRSAQGMAVSWTIPADPEAPKLLGDLDGDGTVGFNDFLELSSNYGNDDAVASQGDLDGDCSVGFSDFLIMSRQYGKSLPTTPIRPIGPIVDLVLAEDLLTDVLIPTEPLFPTVLPFN